MDSKKHRDLANAVDAMLLLAKQLWPYEGKYIRKLGKSNQETIKLAVAQANKSLEGGPVGLRMAMLQAYSPTGAPIMCCGGLQRDIEHCQQKLSDMEKLASLAGFDHYMKLGREFRKATQALRAEAAKVGIAHLAGVAPIVQWPLSDWD
jgi:hypothetical protein